MYLKLNNLSKMRISEPHVFTPGSVYLGHCQKIGKFKVIWRLVTPNGSEYNPPSPKLKPPTLFWLVPEKLLQPLRLFGEHRLHRETVA